MGSHLVLLINVRCFCPLHLGQYALPLSLVPIYFNWSSIYFNWSTLSQLFAIITCSRPSILLSSMLWALAGTWPSNSEQRLLNQTCDGKRLNNLQFLQRIYVPGGSPRTVQHDHQQETLFSLLRELQWKKPSGTSWCPPPPQSLSTCDNKDYRIYIFYQWTRTNLKM